jgi:hypothetical protein
MLPLFGRERDTLTGEKISDRHSGAMCQVTASRQCRFRTPLGEGTGVVMLKDGK